jgi:hypothetical protein
MGVGAKIALVTSVEPTALDLSNGTRPATVGTANAATTCSTNSIRILFANIDIFSHFRRCLFRVSSNSSSGKTILLRF